jgi:DNA-binding NarL/FixJ family response regulator
MKEADHSMKIGPIRLGKEARKKKCGRTNRRFLLHHQALIGRKPTDLFQERDEEEMVMDAAADHSGKVVEEAALAHMRSRQGKPSVALVPVGRPETGPRNEAMRIAVIEDRALRRECFARSIEAEQMGISVVCFSTIEEWQTAGPDHGNISLIILCRNGNRMAGIKRDLEALSTPDGGIPVIVVSDEEGFEEIHQTIQLGARGFIPESMNLHLAVLAMHLVEAGGMYLPESILHTSQESKDSAKRRGIHGLFTERQAAVVEALREGKPNKIIAYDLNMRESTVKVHLRNVMKKLHAKNRTEVAFITSKLFAEGGLAGPCHRREPGSKGPASDGLG